MDVSGEAADLLVKEGVQATETAVKLAGTGLKNVAALLLALSRQEYKVTGKTSSKRLARDPAAAEVVQIRKVDMGRFQKLAKQYGVLYFFTHKKGNENGMTNVVSTVNYAPQLNAILEEMGYPIPEKAQPTAPKKAPPRTPPGKSSQERDNGWKQRAGIREEERPSVKGRLEAIRAASRGEKKLPVPTHEKSR